jgi:hypothetical protein
MFASTVKLLPFHLPAIANPITRRISSLGTHALGLWAFSLLFLVFSSLASAASVTLAWDAVTASDLAGYKLHYGYASRNYGTTVNAGNSTTAAISGLEEGKTYYFAVTAYDTSDNSSDYSNEVRFTVSERDTDGDGLSDREEVETYGTDPTKADTDGDGLTDREEIELHRTDPKRADSDGDGLSDRDEIEVYKTDPVRIDTDGDGALDKTEVRQGSDPLDASSMPSAKFVQLWLEAEAGIVHTPMAVGMYNNTPQGRYVWVPQGEGDALDPSQAMGYVEYSITVPEAGDYVIWGRVNAGSKATKSFFVAVDEGPYIQWDTPVQSGATTWVWDPVSHQGGEDAAVFTLAAGTHTLIIKQREDGTKLNKLLITNNLKFVPTGAGKPVLFQLWLEAEEATLSAPMQTALDNEASSDTYVWVPKGSGTGGVAEYQFTVPTTGTYVVWGRVISNSTSQDSFFVAMDSDSDALWDTKLSGTEVWGWDIVSHRAGTQPGEGVELMNYTLEAGTHTLRIKQRDSGTKLDKLLITNDLSYVPED